MHTSVYHNFNYEIFYSIKFIFKGCRNAVESHRKLSRCTVGNPLNRVFVSEMTERQSTGSIGGVLRDVFRLMDV